MDEFKNPCSTCNEDENPVMGDASENTAPAEDETSDETSTESEGPESTEETSA